MTEVIHVTRVVASCPRHVNLGIGVVQQVRGTGRCYMPTRVLAELDRMGFNVSWVSDCYGETIMGLGQ